MNSFITLWVARENQPSELVINYGPWNLTAGSTADDQKFGKIWLLPYHTGKEFRSESRHRLYVVRRTDHLSDADRRPGTIKLHRIVWLGHDYPFHRWLHRLYQRFDGYCDRHRHDATFYSNWRNCGRWGLIIGVDTLADGQFNLCAGRLDAARNVGGTRQHERL